MIIKELKEEHYSDFIKAVVTSFSKDYISLGITKENAKSNGSFFTKAHLCNYIKNRGVKFFVILDEETVVGGVGIEDIDDYCKIKKLFVSPDYQKQGIGKILMDYVEEYTRLLSKSKIKLGMVLENESLHRFYINCGYTDKKISHNKKMNLKIAFMEKRI